MSCFAHRQAPRPRRREPEPAREATGGCGGESTSSRLRHGLVPRKRLIERCCTLWIDPMRWLEQGRGFATGYLHRKRGNLIEELHPDRLARLVYLHRARAAARGSVQSSVAKPCARAPSTSILP